MHGRTTHPDVSHRKISASEHDTIRDAVADLVPRLECLTEAGMLDELGGRAAEVRQDLPCLADLLRRTATRSGHKILVLDPPGSTADGLRPTPLHRAGPGLLPVDLYRGLLVSVGGWYGYGFATQQAGVIHNDVVPIRELADVANHNGSVSRGFALHTEEAAFNIGPGLDVSPELLTLHCLRNPTGVPTAVAAPDWSEFSGAARGVLEREEFFNEIGLSHGGRENSAGVPASIIYGPADDPRIRVNFGTIDLGRHSPEQQEALLELKCHLESRKIDLALRAGQIVFVDNRRVVHGRPAHEPEHAPRYDGTDRWLRRLVATDNPGRILPYEAAGRIVDPRRMVTAARSPRQASRTATSNTDGNTAAGESL